MNKRDRRESGHDADVVRSRELALNDLHARRGSYQRPKPDVDRVRGSDRVRRRQWAALVAIVKDIPFDAGVTALGRELAQRDGFPSTPSGAGRAPVEESVPLTVVEALAGQMLPLSKDMETVDRCVQAITMELRRLQHVVARWAPTSYVHVPCEVGTYHDEWALPRKGEAFPCPDEAEHYPSGNPHPSHLCPKHRKRKERWERTHEVDDVA